MFDNLTELDEYIPPDVARLLDQRVTPEQYEQLIYEGHELRLELTSDGQLLVVPHAGGESGRRNADLTCQLVSWAKEDGTGVCCGPSGIFALPNGARRIADASWVKRVKWQCLSKQEREGFAPFCPDFVVELRFINERGSQLREKMVEYLENGASLGWLIDPYERRVYVYEPNRELVIIQNPETVSGEPLLPGFRLNMAELL